jgi:AraC family transcriptional regulator
MLGNHMLYRSPLVTIADLTCHTHDAECSLGATERHRLVFTRAGAALARRVGVGACDFVSDPVQAVFLLAGTEYRMRHPGQAPHACTVFAFASGVIPTDVGPGHRSATAKRRLIRPDVLLRYHRLRQALLDHSGLSGSTLAVEEEAMALLDGTTRLREAGFETGPFRAPSHRDLAESAKMVLASAPGSAHRLGDVAEWFGVSASHLAHVFRAVVGIPMHQYLLQMRLGIALDRVGGGATNLSELALELGFVSHSHFTAAFRRYFGIPPRDVRRALAPRSGARVTA